MNVIYKILIFSVFSYTIPIGKIFEIFVWQDNIIKTEYVVKKTANKNSSNVLLLKFDKKAINTKNNSIFNNYHINYEKIENSKNNLTLFTFKILFNNIKTRTIHRFVFNLIFSDENSFSFAYRL